MKTTWAIAAALLLVAAATMDASAKGREFHRHGNGAIQKNPLGLTEDQQAQIEALREQYRANFEAILTDEQLAILEERKNPLGLTEDQQAQIEALKGQTQTRVEYRASFEAILTDEQLAILEERKNGYGSRTSLSDPLGLTEDQQAQIEALREQQRASFEAILTDEQLAILEERKNGYGRHCPKNGATSESADAAGKATTSAEETSWGRLKESFGQ